MIKFSKVQSTEIRKAIEVDENGNRIAVRAIIGQALELLKNEIIFDDNVKGNEKKWLVILEKTPDNILEFNSLDDAKSFIKAWENIL